jgi:hypothetical protein
MYLVENEPNILAKDTDEEQLDAAAPSQHSVG